MCSLDTYKFCDYVIIMIQVDVFWSFAMGACFACSAQKALAKDNAVFVNKYFIYTVCYLSMLFAPSGIYLLWQHTGWETMFFFSKDLHGVWVCLFAHTNVLLGVLGYLLARHFIRSGDVGTAHALWVGGYCGMFGILSLGYDRFMYAGTLEEWNRGVKYSLTDFFSSQVFSTLLVMSVFLLPPLFYPMTFWPAHIGMSRSEKREMLQTTLSLYGLCTALVLTGFNVGYVMGMLPPGWGYDRIGAYLCYQGAFGGILFAPLLCIPARRKTKP